MKWKRQTKRESGMIQSDVTYRSCDSEDCGKGVSYLIQGLQAPINV